MKQRTRESETKQESDRKKRNRERKKAYRDPEGGKKQLCEMWLHF